LIGINTAILGPNGGNIGIGFSIPSNMMKNLTDQILKYGEVKRGMLGVKGGEVNSDLAEALGLDSSKGAFVSEVMPHTAAAKAGLKAGDVIISINGKTIHSFAELRAKVATLGVGKKIKMGVIRDGDQKTFNVTLGKQTESKTKASDLHQGLAGASFVNTGSDDGMKGVKVSAVKAHSPADQYQLKKGDIIIGVNRHRVKNIADLRHVLEKKPSVLALNIKRGAQTLYLVVR
ncbi:MAG: PDZ domain-containing protein, partial [Vibrio sp.]